ncbi:MTG-like gene family protein [Alphaentomopoxvirus acuprea]|uniref:MTG-like gene family protein n=1 Tax=Alphaentomopoxvirus acuprea TaxID=62099 RepID=W6JJ21_9POXV|nr:MTG-like gene family protein [Anomala cuprea entomopoxvirus]YP_009001736.1 MTG-like gene family protein [Anomala cuprea entomopoxvirus]BAO49361.1 MTG-like gene family protein [Anomala cuprea entomopoxvirus]BAO49623.1 MTG-like gene family protein [Anomala cuprea entomopoxvirus]
MIQDLLIDFKDKKDKELYIMHYTYLEKCVIIAKENYNEPYDYINDLIKNNLHKMYELRPIIPENIYLTINNNIIMLNNLSMENQLNIIYEKLKEYHDSKNKKEYYRDEIIKYLNDNHITFNKTKTWNIIKQVGNNLKLAIKYK